MTDLQSKFWDSFIEAFESKKFMKAIPQINSLSTTSVMLNMFFENEPLAKGTGWFWRLSNGIALVTAWHNFSGLHHTDRTTLSSKAGMPDRIRFRYVAKEPLTFQETEVPLYLDEDRTQPRWYVHSECGSFFDMAFLGLELNGGDVTCINDAVSIQPDGSSKPGQDVFAIGYPQAVATMGVFPIWKRGSIASEPDTLVDGHPKFFVDMAGRGGLSGAPVFCFQRGTVINPTTSGQEIGFGEKTEFLGLYSGRVADQLPADARSGESTDLGFVWRSDVVIEMLNNGVLDEKPEVGKGKQIIKPIWRKEDFA